jgi:hypothetical protein
MQFPLVDTVQEFVYDTHCKIHVFPGFEIWSKVIKFMESSTI